MARREIDDKTVINRGRYSVVKIVMLTFAGCVFVSLGLALIIMDVRDMAQAIRIGKSMIGGIVLFLVLTLMLFGFGGTALYFAWRDVYHWIMTHITKKKGEIGYAHIIDSRSISQGNRTGMNINRYYGFELSYEKDGEQKTAKTDTVFDINEYRYLKSLPQVKIKIYKNYVAIDEEFRYEIYKLDSRYGLPKRYFVEKPFSTILNIWRIVSILSIVLFFVLFALTIALKVNTFVFVGFALLTVSNLVCGIVYAIYFYSGR